MNDGPAGLRATDLVSGFPPGIAAAATFNKQLIYQRGVAIGEEFRIKGAHVFLGPAMGQFNFGFNATHMLCSD